MLTFDVMSERLRLKWIEISKVFNEANPNHFLWAEEVPQKPNKMITDTHKAWERQSYSIQYRNTRLLLEHRPDDKDLKKLESYFLSEYRRIEREYPLPEINFNELIDEINRAFFRLEEFTSGRLGWYNYYGFNDAFTKLFIISKNPKYYSIHTCKLIGQYWMLLTRIDDDLNKADYENDTASTNEDFEKDCVEIGYLQWDRIEEFNHFTTQDEIDDYEKKFGIADIYNFISSGQQAVHNFAIKTITNPDQAQPQATKADILREHLAGHGFFELPKLSGISDQGRTELISKMSNKGLPYQVAMFDHLGFIDYLLMEKCNSIKLQAYKLIGKILDKGADGVKKNILALNPMSQIDKNRYTAHLYIESVKNDIELLKKGVPLG
jgi:hypothetical protein